MTVQPEELPDGSKLVRIDGLLLLFTSRYSDFFLQVKFYLCILSRSWGLILPSELKHLWQTNSLIKLSSLNQSSLYLSFHKKRKGIRF